MCPPPPFFIYFLLKIPPPDQTLGPTCKFLILVKVPPPLFLFVKTIEKVIRLCTVFKFFFEWYFEDRAIFHVIQLSYEWGGPYVPITDR